MTLRRGAICAGVLLLTLSACASKPPDPNLGIGRWLNEGERTIGIEAPTGGWTESVFVIRRSTALAKSGEAALGSSLGALTGGPVGVLLMPVAALGGAIVGAATADPIYTYVSFADLKDAEALFDAVSLPGELVERLGAAVVEAARTRTSHNLTFVDPYQGRDEFPGDHSGALEPAMQRDASITLYARIGLVGNQDAKQEANPRVGLFVDGHTRVSIRRKPPEYDSSAVVDDWRYEGRREPLSTWAADDGRLLREEVARAVDELADEIVDGVVALQTRAAARSIGPARRQ